jgi:hypothetical protein
MSRCVHLRVGHPSLEVAPETLAKAQKGPRLLFVDVPLDRLLRLLDEGRGVGAVGPDSRDEGLLVCAGGEPFG